MEEAKIENKTRHDLPKRADRFEERSQSEKARKINKSNRPHSAESDLPVAQGNIRPSTTSTQRAQKPSQMGNASGPFSSGAELTRAMQLTPDELRMASSVDWKRPPP